MNRVLKVTVCAVITAISTVIMLLTSVIPVGTYALPAIAGATIIPLITDISKKWAFASFAVSSVLSLFLAGDKEAVFLFILFFGYYPIMKSIIESVELKIIMFILKLLIFNVAVIISYFLAFKILGLPSDSFTIMGVNLPLLFLIIGNAVFLLYDYALTTVKQAYVIRLRPYLFKILKK